MEDQRPLKKAKSEESTSVDHIKALIESNRHLASQIQTLTNITTHRGMTIPEVGILVKTDCQLTTSKGVKTRLPVIVGCNLFRLATFQFIHDYGKEALKLFEYPQYIDQLFFSCILLFYYSE